MESGNDEEGKRVMYVEDQLIVSSIANTSATTNKAKEAAAAAATADTTAEEEEKKEAAPTEEDLEAQRMKTNWTKLFLENDGWNYILEQFLAKEFNSDAATTFTQQARLKDLAFILTLMRVFL